MQTVNLGWSIGFDSSSSVSGDASQSQALSPVWQWPISVSATQFTHSSCVAVCLLMTNPSGVLWKWKIQVGNLAAKGVLEKGYLRAEADGIVEERAGGVNRDMATH